MVYVDGGRVRALTRNDKTLMTTFPELRDIGEFLGSRSAILDGEIVTLDKDGRPSFAILAHRLHLTSRHPRSSVWPSQAPRVSSPSTCCTSRVTLPRRHLRRAARGPGAAQIRRWTFATPPSSTNVKGSDMLRIAKERGLEGVVAKRRASHYAPGQRNGDWIKIKNFHTQEVVIGGWTAGQGERAGSLGALLLGVHTDEGFTYVGKVGTGFSAASRKELLDTLSPSPARPSPFVERLSPSETALAHFVRPQLVGEVRFAEWTADGHLRHPSWRGLRTDKIGEEVAREP